MESPQTPKGPGRLILIGGLLALLAGVAIAWALLSQGRGERTPPPPASQAGLVIDSTGEDGRIDATRPLRCFVQGQYVGELTLADCARRNGVATDALDVGLDQTGALAAAQDAGAQIVPLPPVEEAPYETPESALPPVEAEEPEPVAGEVAACLRHRGGQWRRLPGEMDLNGCVQALFAGRCEREGQASYGRFGGQTLRLVAGRVEISSDNQSFRTLAPQRPGCSLPPV